MSKRLDVLIAIRTLIIAAVPGAEVIAAWEADDQPVDEAAAVTAGGRIAIESGTFGEPEIDLSPLSYNWIHEIPIGIMAIKVPGISAEAVVDAMMAPIGAAIAADPSLGGLCDWLEPTAPTTDDVFVDGGTTPRGANFAIRAHYSTSTPLT